MSLKLPVYGVQMRTNESSVFSRRSGVLCVFKKLANFVGRNVIGVATQLPGQLQRTQNKPTNTAFKTDERVRVYRVSVADPDI